MANASLDARGQELKALSRVTIAVEEEERRRVSRELHDGISQQLAAIKMTLDIAARLDDESRRTELLQQASASVEQAIDEVHHISQGLRPVILDDLGLREAMEWYIQHFEKRFAISITRRLNDIPPLSKECEITAYRFLQEALTNIYKHAHATEVTITNRQQANYLMLLVADNGIGFDMKTRKLDSSRLSLGLTGLQERTALVGGELIIHSKQERGTTLIVLLPIDELAG
jgi:signal transduction histidine kinase